MNDKFFLFSLSLLKSGSFLRVQRFFLPLVFQFTDFGTVFSAVITPPASNYRLFVLRGTVMENFFSAKDKGISEDLRGHTCIVYAVKVLFF